MLPKSMHLGACLTGELVEAVHGGQAVIYQAQHNNHLVAVKTIRINMSSDFDKCYSVNGLTFTCLENFLTVEFVGILSGGCCVETSPTPKYSAIAWCGFG